MVRNKIHTELIAGLDIGSTAVRIAVGQLTYSRDTGTDLQLIGAVEVESEGVQKGQIASIEDAVSSVSGALEHAEKMIGLPIEHVWVGVSGTQIVAQESKGVVAVSRANSEISEEDVERAVDAAKNIATPLNYEILHVLPRAYAVDNQEGIKDPIGMTGMRLVVDAKIIHTIASHTKNLQKVVYRTSVDIDDFVLGILAGGDVVTTRRQKELGCVVINIGGSTTSVIVYEDGDVIHSAVIPMGSSHITNDLAIGLKTSIDVVEQVKCQYGEASSRNISKKEVVDLADCGNDQSEIVSRYYIAQIIEARMAEILERVDEELASIGRSQMLPAGAIFVGGGAKLQGLIECSKDILGLPSQIGYPLAIESITDKVNDTAFVTAIGLVRWGSVISTSVAPKKSGSDMFGKGVEKMRNIFKNLVP